jgi:hypothetical protein
MVEFECEHCGHTFSAYPFECGKQTHCQGDDPYCSCAGITYYKGCPKCDADCETFED